MIGFIAMAANSEDRQKRISTKTVGTRERKAGQAQVFLCE
jgi:hypothetical protein